MSYHHNIACSTITVKSALDQRYSNSGAHAKDWIALCSVLRPRQHSIGYMGDGFYRSKDPTNSIKVLKEKAEKENNPKTRKKRKITHMHNTHKM